MEDKQKEGFKLIDPEYCKPNFENIPVWVSDDIWRFELDQGTNKGRINLLTGYADLAMGEEAKLYEFNTGGTISYYVYKSEEDNNPGIYIITTSETEKIPEYLKLREQNT